MPPGLLVALVLSACCLWVFLLASIVFLLLPALLSVQKKTIGMCCAFLCCLLGFTAFGDSDVRGTDATQVSRPGCTDCSAGNLYCAEFVN